jgi:hypothetical protein
MDGAVAHAVDERGAEARIDLSGVSHPDAALATRTTRVYVAGDGVGAGGYRGRTVHPSAVETERDRAERARILAANRLEIAMRLGLCGLMVLDAWLWASSIMYRGLQ